ncbi:acetate/propionate family kinase, partial [Actinosynnema sp. NPDC059797]
EHDPELRARVINGLAFLGLTLDPDANTTASGDTEIGTGVWVVTAREDVEIAAGTRAALAAREPG